MLLPNSTIQLPTILMQAPSGVGCGRGNFCLKFSLSIWYPISPHLIHLSTVLIFSFLFKPLYAWTILWLSLVSNGFKDVSNEIHCWLVFDPLRTTTTDVH